MPSGCYSPFSQASGRCLERPQTSLYPPQIRHGLKIRPCCNPDFGSGPCRSFTANTELIKQFTLFLLLYQSAYHFFLTNFSVINMQNGRNIALIANHSPVFRCIFHRIGEMNATWFRIRLKKQNSLGFQSAKQSDVNPSSDRMELLHRYVRHK